MPYKQTGGLEGLQAELAKLPDEIIAEGKKIVSKGMLNIKRGAQAKVRVEQWAHLPHLPRSFSYGVDELAKGVVRGQGGADMEKLQGKLDIYVENGTAHTPANAHWTRSFDEELPNFERYAEDYLHRLVSQ
jgi:hypothetical protein